MRGASVTQPGRYALLFKEHQGANIGSLWDVQSTIWSRSGRIGECIGL